MTIIRLKGGLGNQMFQYAAGYRKNNSTILFEISELSNRHDALRAYELNTFKNIKEKFLPSYFLRILSILNRFTLTSFFVPKSLKNITSIHDNNFEEFDGTDRLFYLSGYFQDPTFFNHKREELLIQFQFPNLPDKILPVEEKIKSTNAVCIHVRRGDYLNPETIEYHGILPLSYYQKAIETMTNVLDKPQFFIFSDDPSWCEVNFEFIEHEKTIISNQETPSWVDMYLMTKCNHHIIANSSFSWWGAWLSQATNKMVIAPQKWFVNEKTNIIPKEWIVL